MKPLLIGEKGKEENADIDEDQDNLDDVIEETATFQPSNCAIKNLAYFFAFGAEVGNLPNGYFIFRATVKAMIDIFMELNDDDTISKESKVVCYIFAFYFCFHIWINDFLAINPAENFQHWYEKFSTLCPSDSNQGFRLCKRLIFTPLYILTYIAFSVLSMASAAGLLELFTDPLVIWALGIPLSAVTTMLGVSYYYQFFHSRIADHLVFYKECCFHPYDTLKSILQKPAAACQVGKIFLITATYNTVMGAFYVYSITDQLNSGLKIPIDNEKLLISTVASSICIFIANALTRFLPTKNNFFSNRVFLIANDQKKSIKCSSGFCADTILELGIFSAGIALSLRNKKYNYFFIIPASLSLLTGLPAVYNSHRQKSLYTQEQSLQPAQHKKIYRFCSWINLNSRILKSILVYSALLSILKSNEQSTIIVDLLGNGGNRFCWTLIIGALISLNNFSVYQDSLYANALYLWAKLQIEKEQPFFGKALCFFRSKGQYPTYHQQKMTQIIGEYLRWIQLPISER